MADAGVLYLHPAKHAVDLRPSANAPLLSPHALIPVGIPGMLNLLRRNAIRVRALNLFLETLLDSRFDFPSWLARQATPRLIAIDLHWYEHSFGALALARACKRVFPQVPIVLGGLTASYFAREILAAHSQVDCIIRGDGEQGLLALALVLGSGEGNASHLAEVPNLLYRQGTAISENPRSYCATAEDLDLLDHVEMSWLVHEPQYAALAFNGPKIAVPIQAPDNHGRILASFSGGAASGGQWLTIGRGCCYDCSFCGGGAQAQQTIAGRSGIVRRSAERVVEDIARLAVNGLKQVALNLDLAIMPRPYWAAVLDELQHRGVKIGLYDEAFQMPEDAFLEAFAQTADLDYSQLVLSPLSGAEEVRHLNGKHFTNQRLLDALRVLKRHKVPVFVYFSLNIPGETEKTFRQTLHLAREIAALYPAPVLSMANMLHTVDPCAPMSAAPASFGVQVEFRTFADYYRYCHETSIWRAGMPLDSWRGYRSANKRLQPLEAMAHDWDAFCATVGAQCYPVPRMW